MTTLKTKIVLAALSLFLASSAWALKERDNRLRAEGRAEVAQEAVDSLTAVVEAADARVRADSIRADSVKAEADSIRDEAERVVAEIRNTRPALVDSVVVEAGLDSVVVRMAVERVSASYEAEISELQRATLAARATIDSQADYIEALEIKDRASRALIANLQAQVEAITRSGGSGIEDHWAVKVAVVGAAAYAGYKTGKHVHGS